MRRRNRETEQFSISFLDVASCGFGAIIILLMITKSAAPATEDLTETLPAGVVQELQEQLFAIRSETTELRQELNSSQERNASVQQLIASLRSQREALEGEFASASQQGDETTEEIGQLLLARQTLTEEMQRLFADTHRHGKQLHRWRTCRQRVRHICNRHFRQHVPKRLGKNA